MHQFACFHLIMYIERYISQDNRSVVKMVSVHHWPCAKPYAWRERAREKDILAWMDRRASPGARGAAISKVDPFWDSDAFPLREKEWKVAECRPRMPVARSTSPGDARCASFENTCCLCNWMPSVVAQHLPVGTACGIRALSMKQLGLDPTMRRLDTARTTSSWCLEFG